MKKLLVTSLVLMVSMLAFVACSKGGNVEDESAGDVVSFVSSVADDMTSDFSRADSNTATSSENMSGASSQVASK